LCSHDLRTQGVIKIQKALKQQGYYFGPFDDILGQKTKDAVLRFQKDKHLPVGNFNVETLKALGVWDEDD
jgi:peptidoglycan hydrolase-like protein with peptidoglycan-binding domain